MPLTRGSHSAMGTLSQGMTHLEHVAALQAGRRSYRSGGRARIERNDSAHLVFHRRGLDPIRYSQKTEGGGQNSPFTWIGRRKEEGKIK